MLVVQSIRKMPLVWRQLRQRMMYLSLSMEPSVIGTVFVVEVEEVVKVEADKVEADKVEGDVVESLMIERTSLERTEEMRMGK